MLCGDHVGFGVVHSAKTSSDSRFLLISTPGKFVFGGKEQVRRGGFLVIWGGEEAMLETLQNSQQCSPEHESSPLQSLL